MLKTRIGISISEESKRRIDELVKNTDCKSASQLFEALSLMSEAQVNTQLKAARGRLNEERLARLSKRSASRRLARLSKPRQANQFTGEELGVKRKQSAKE